MNLLILLTTTLVVSCVASRDWSQVGADIDGEATSDYSGWSVSLSSGGTRLAIGAQGNDAGEDPGHDAGHVRVFEYDSSSWVQLGADIDGEAASDRSGYSVSLSADGDRVAIGALQLSGYRYGYVRVFEYDSSSWVQLGASIYGEAANDRNGYSLSLSADGGRVAIGAYGNDGGGNSAGHVRVFEYSSSSWGQLGSDINGEAASDASGISVSLSADGGRVAIGSPYNDNGGFNFGHVRVFEYASLSWVQLGADIEGEATNDQNGRVVSLSADGNRVAIAAPYRDNAGANNNVGYVRVFEYESSSWGQVGADIYGEAEYDYFGFSLSLSADGGRLAIGSYLNDDVGSNAGHVRVFEYASSSWGQLGADINGEAANDYMGKAISLSADGNQLATGSYYANSGTGQVQVWKLSGMLHDSALILH